jgi:hypothetical protein
MQQHGESRGALDERSDRGAVLADNEISFPVTRYRPVYCFGGALGDHDLGVDELLTASARATPRDPERTACPQVTCLGLLSQQ